MIKKLLPVSWAVTKIVIKLIVVLTLLIGLFNVNHKINLLSNIVEEQYNDSNDRYNQLLDNDISTLQQLQEVQKDNKDIVNRILGTDVFVKGFLGEGAGTIIKKTDTNMYILTCNHVVDDIIKLNKAGIKISATIGYSKSDKKDTITGLIIYGAEIIKYDKENDLALLKTFIIDDKLEAVPLAENEPQLGDTVYSIGTPLGLYRTISKGILSHKEEGFYFSDNTTTYGNSGGGLYNINGELIGVPSNVMGYLVSKKLKGYYTYLQNEEQKFVPETSLGLSISLFRIKAFLEGVEY